MKAVVPSIFRGHPRGVLLLSATEMWERFSYYGMAALLTLFLSAAPASGGFGWSKADALQLFGVYTALVFISPVVGGWLATTWLGERRSVLIGGCIIAMGHVLIGAPAYGPWLIELATEVPVETVLRESAVALARPVLPHDARAAFEALLSQRGIEGGAGVVVFAWYLQGWSVYLALLLIVAGTGLLKAPIASLVGKLYEPGDSRREAGFTLFMVGVWFGSLAAELVVGALGERVGWHIGLATAGAGMIVGLTLYLLWQRRLLGQIGIRPEGGGARGAAFRLEADERPRMLALLVMSIYTVLFCVAYYQQSGALHLLLFEHGDRTLFGFTIPATWAMSVTTLSFVVLAPFASAIYAWLRARGIDVDIVVKQTIGLAAMAVAYAVLWIATWRFSGEPGARISILWFFIAYFLFAVGDVCIWPPQISALSQYAPQRCLSLVMGAWYVTVGVGSWISSMMGALSYRHGLSWMLGWLLALCAIAAVSLLLLRPWLKALLGENNIRRHGQCSAESKIT